MPKCSEKILEPELETRISVDCQILCSGGDFVSLPHGHDGMKSQLLIFSQQLSHFGSNLNHARTDENPVPANSSCCQNQSIFRLSAIAIGIGPSDSTK